MKKASKYKIAVKYALALYEAAAEKKAVAKVYNDAKKLMAEVDRDADFIKYFSNPTWDAESKRDALKAIAKKMDLTVESLKCMDVIADNNRFADFDIILKEFIHVYHVKQNIVEVEVSSAKALSSSQVKKLEENIEKMISKKIIVSYEVKPELLGGLKIKYGSKMIDDTVSGKLNRLEQIMKGGQ